MYLDRRLHHDPLSLSLGPIEREVVEKIEASPGQPVTAKDLGVSQQALVKAVQRLRDKGFNIDCVYRHGGYFWDGTSK